MKTYTAKELKLEDARTLKKERKVCVVFSTFGEREADLIYDKIKLIREKCLDFVDMIVLSHRRVGDAPERTEEMARKAWDKTDILVCNTYKVADMGSEKGKGADMRRSLYFLKTEKGMKDSDVVVFLDTDVVSEFFGEHFVMGLASAVLDGNDFAKGSFWRAMGRVKKYVAQPLFSVIEHPDLKELTKLSYPLSGEVAGTINFFSSVNFWQMYGVETGINVDAVCGQWQVADVNLGLYDHEHSSDTNIQKMAFGIIRTYLKKLEENGFIECKKGASIADTFSMSYIDEKEERQVESYDLTERSYKALGK